MTGARPRVVEQLAAERGEAVAGDQPPRARADERDEQAGGGGAVEADPRRRRPRAGRLGQRQLVRRVEAVDLRRLAVRERHAATVAERPHPLQAAVERDLERRGQPVHVLGGVGTGLVLQRVQHADVDLVDAREVARKTRGDGGDDAGHPAEERSTGAVGAAAVTTAAAALTRSVQRVMSSSGTPSRRASRSRWSSGSLTDRDHGGRPQRAERLGAAHVQGDALGVAELLRRPRRLLHAAAGDQQPQLGVGGAHRIGHLAAHHAVPAGDEDGARRSIPRLAHCSRAPIPTGTP